MHSARLFCSIPFGLVHSYTHTDRQAWKAGSAFVPFTAGSTSLASAGRFPYRRSATQDVAVEARKAPRSTVVEDDDDDDVDIGVDDDDVVDRASDF